MQVTTTVLGEVLGRFLEAKFFDTDVAWCWAQVPTPMAVGHVCLHRCAAALMTSLSVTLF